MAHRCKYEERLDIKNGVVKRILKAIFKDKKEDCYYEDSSGKAFSTNYLNCYGVGGYLFIFSGEKTNSYYGNVVADNSTFYEINEKYNIWCFKKEKYSQDFLNEISKTKYKYLFNKIKNEPYCYIINALSIYNIFPKMEYLINSGYLKLALDKRLTKMSNKKLREIMIILKTVFLTEEQKKVVTLNQLYLMKKNNVSFDLANRCIKDKCTPKVAEYCDKQNTLVEIYRDYLRMLKRTHHDIKDKYWLFPKNIIDAHSSVIEEVNQIEKTKKLEKEKDKLCNISKISQKFEKKEINGYSIFVPDSFNQFKKTCDILHQCLIACDYIGKMAQGNCILFFIWKNDTPIATAEVNTKKKILQFYADEKDRENCYPTKEVKQIFNNYLKDIKIPRALI